MSKTKKQHFVPQFLLRNFVGPTNKLWVYDKINGKTYQTGTDSTACDGYFYDDAAVAAATGDAQFVEHALSRAEGKWSQTLTPLLQRIRRYADIGLTLEERMNISEMMAIQMIRTPFSRLSHHQTMSQIVDLLRARGATDEELENCSPPISRDPEKWDTKGVHVTSMLNAENVAKFQSIFAGHVWWFLRSAGHGSFYLSDHPIGKRAHNKLGRRYHNGIASPGIEIAVPMAHDVVLVMFERSLFPQSECLDGRAGDALTSENLLYYNSMQVQSSLRFVYSNTNDFAHAETVCVAEPFLRNPKRQIMEIAR